MSGGLGSGLSGPGLPQILMMPTLDTGRGAVETGERWPCDPRREGKQPRVNTDCIKTYEEEEEEERSNPFCSAHVTPSRTGNPGVFSRSFLISSSFLFISHSHSCFHPPSSFDLGFYPFYFPGMFSAASNIFRRRPVDPAPAASYEVPLYTNAAYYPNWRIYRKQPPSSLRLGFVSHVFYAFAW